MKLWKVRIKTFLFVPFHYDLFVMTDTEEKMLDIIHQDSRIKEDAKAEIESYYEIDLTDETNRVL